jgi:hypothetical protein
VLALICRSYGADRDLDAGSYKDFAPTEHHLGLPNVQNPQWQTRVGTPAPQFGTGVLTRHRPAPPAHFHRTLWAVAGWLLFHVARSLRIDLRYARRYCQSGSDRLEKQSTDPAVAGRKAWYIGDRTQICRLH